MSGATYDIRRDRFLFNYASYIGGETYRVPPPTSLSDAKVQWTSPLSGTGAPLEPRTETERYNTYLVPHIAESPASFKVRLQLAAYVNPVEIIVDAYAEGVSANVQRQLGALEDVSSDVDLRGNTWAEFSEDTARWTAVYGVTATVVDAPKSADDIITAGDESANGQRPYTVLVHPSAWAWLDVDAFGRLTEFAYVDQPYVPSSVAGAGTRQQITVRVFCAERTDADGKKIPAGWKVLAGTITASAPISAQRAEFGKVVDEGPLDPRLKGRLPVVFAYYRRDSSSRYPMGLSLVDNACDLARTIYNKRSWEQQIAREAGFPTLAVPSGKTGGQMDPQARIEIGPSKAIGYSSDTGAPSWIQPSSEWAKDLRDSCMQDFQLALRSAGLELAADQSSQVQSGEALRIRSRDFESRCKRFARHMQRWEVAVLDLMAILNGTVADHTVTYPTRFTLPDLANDLARALQILSPTTMPIEIGATAKLEAACQAINAAIVLPDDQQQKVREEIQAVLEQDAAEITAGRDVAGAQRSALLDKLRGKPAAPTPVTDGNEAPR